MMNAQEYILTPTQKAIDITGGGYTSFTTVINVTCENLQDTFEYSIVDEIRLNSDPILNKVCFSKQKGTVEDLFTLEPDTLKGIQLQSLMKDNLVNLGCKKWYLVLRADKETKCTVTINTRSLEPLNEEVLVEEEELPEPPTLYTPYTHILNQTCQLIDINDAYTSFTTLMNVTCSNNLQDFEYAIINQNTLDSSHKINFKKIVGSWEDSFTVNQEKFQNWYLVLKADKDTKCTVKLNIRSLDANPTPSTQNIPDESPPENSTPTEERDEEEDEQDFFKWAATRPSGCTIYYKCNFNNTTR